MEVGGQTSTARPGADNQPAPGMDSKKTANLGGMLLPRLFYKAFRWIPMMKTKLKNYHTLSLCVMSWMLVVLGGPVFAQQKAAGPEPRSRLEPESKEAAIPTCLETLTLTQQQQDKIKEIVREYDADIASVWKQFGNLYLESIRTEVLLLSAIEDNLTEAQREQVREQRRKTAQHQKSVEGKEVKPNQARTRPASAVEQEIAIVGVSLTLEQELAADKLQETYLSDLRTLNRDIQGLHIRLVSLEADKLVEIENVLTKDQLQQLREIRKTAPAQHAATAKRTSAAESR
jgi:hypothetical protein